MKRQEGEDEDAVCNVQRIADLIAPVEGYAKKRKRKTWDGKDKDG